jgi:hypothetical protein
MNANELRIGNYAIVKDAPIEAIIRVRAQHIAEAEEHNPSWFLYPIPLTPEILVKCGFKKELVVGKSDKFFYSLNGLSYNECHVAWWYRGVLDFQIKYLHQLQNLYFALTGTELTVNL